MTLSLLQRGRSIAGAEIRSAMPGFRLCQLASTGPLHCWSGDHTTGITTIVWGYQASTGPLHCWSGDVPARVLRRSQKSSFNGAAPLLERRLRGSSALAPHAPLQRGRSIAGAEI